MKELFEITKTALNTVVEMIPTIKAIENHPYFTFIAAIGSAGATICFFIKKIKNKLK